MALAGSVVAAMKPATSNADNAIESFMLFSPYQRLQMIPERPALRCSPLLSAMERLTTASPAGLIQIKDAQNYFGHSRFCNSPSSPASKVMRNTSRITAVPSGKRAFFLNIDFASHVAIVAEIAEDGRSVIGGGERYIVVQPGSAEIAFVVVDAYQDQGIGTILMRHLAVLARDGSLKELVAEVLPENTAMLKLFKKFGFRTDSKKSPQVAHLTLQLP
jgi:GNAT superfamily N-acetyltransferase